MNKEILVFLTAVLMACFACEGVESKPNGGAAGSDTVANSGSDSKNDSNGDTNEATDGDSDGDSGGDSKIDSNGDSGTDTGDDSDFGEDSELDSASDSEVDHRPVCIDEDSDGWCVPFDCNDLDPAINPHGEVIVGNGIDEGCSGVEDDTGVDSHSEFGGDSDSDSGSDSEVDHRPVCIDEDSDSWCVPFDCNDLDPAINPHGEDIVGNGIDEDCNGVDADTLHTGGPAPKIAELWYSVENMLVNVKLDEADGSITEATFSPIEGLLIGFTSLTMLEDGSLFGCRLSGGALANEMFYIPAPRADGLPVEYISFGPMIDDISIEALYTDCEGRVFAMDTGVDVGSAVGNRLLVFTGDYLEGDFTYEVVSDWSQGNVADIDDLGPGINSDGEISDANGFAVDSGNIYAFNYEAGNGVLVGEGGDWAIHALGGSLFTDYQARLYVMDREGILTQMDSVTFDVVGEPFAGPVSEGGTSGWAALTGPLTNCTTEFTIIWE